MSNTTLYREGTDGQEKEQQIREALIKAMVEHQLPLAVNFRKKHWPTHSGSAGPGSGKCLRALPQCKWSI